MSKLEYSPILNEGFKEIKLWELDKYFLEPFSEKEQRTYLINRLQEFLNEFRVLGIEAEVWIDGSFTTSKPEPVDIDIALLLNQSDVDSLDEKKAMLFDRLVIQKPHVLARYSCDVYLVDKNNKEEIEEWIRTFGTDYNNINSKGIFKVILKPHV